VFDLQEVWLIYGVCGALINKKEEEKRGRKGRRKGKE
jgi:hypothetical protein